jgi:hypothetical protein
MPWLCCFKPEGYVSVRDGETKVGQRVLIPGRGLLAPDCQHSSDETPPPTKKQRGDNPTEVLESLLSLAKHSGATFAILGVHEDVGPRANFGRGGALPSVSVAFRVYESVCFHFAIYLSIYFPFLRYNFIHSSPNINGIGWDNQLSGQVGHRGVWVCAFVRSSAIAKTRMQAL